ncbi:MAG TPA: type IV secretion system DNA-binding domain-containing protein [Anaerolineales bacterium]|jgi:type IV secretory pathway TraG/TraD family ATPase VirD4
MKAISVFEGNNLLTNAPILPIPNARCRLEGIGLAGQDIYVPIDDYLFSQHMLFLGSIGTGKTNGIFQIISQLRNSMTLNDVMVIFDTKGDFYNSFYRKGDIVISNDEKATGEGKVDYWNIFNEIELDESMEENIVEVSRTLFHERSHKSNQPFFPNAARDLFTGILLHFCRSADQVKPDNDKLRNFLDRSPAADIRAMLQSHEDLKAIVSYIADDRSPQTQGVISELQQLVREIFVGNFRREGSLSLRKAIRSKGGKIIFIEYDLGIGGMLTPIYRLMLDMAIKEALGRKKSEGNVWFIIDEFRLVPNLQHIDDGVNFGRSLGAKFIIGVQNVEHIFHSYGESLARSILSGFLTTVAFRVSDSTTRKFIQELFGKNRKKDVFMATVQSRGVIEQVRDANVVEDWDISNLNVGRAILGLPGMEPFYFQFKKYDE